MGEFWGVNGDLWTYIISVSDYIFLPNTPAALEVKCCRFWHVPLRSVSFKAWCQLAVSASRIVIFDKEINDTWQNRRCSTLKQDI